MQFLRRSRGRLGYIGAAVGVTGGALALMVAMAVPAGATVITETLGPGSTGAQVSQWQTDINFFIGYQDTCHPTLSVDGDYGTLTTNATKCFQSLEGDSVDGIAGPDTLSTMCGYLKARSNALYTDTCG